MPNVKLADLLGQPDVSAFLRGVVARARYGNAYLFHGPAGVGKGTAALAFARAALCDRVPGAAAFTPREAASPSLFGDALPETAPAATADDACGVCPACVKSAALAHPDLKFLFPVSGEEKEVEETLVPETFEALRTNPLFTFQYEKAASIRVKQTRDLQHDLAYKPYEAARRVVVIRDCDRMREDQYSTLLKSIEEPGATTTWVLTTARPSRVPATIRSRCQRIRFGSLPETLIRQFLTTRAGAGEKDAVILAALASGSLARALVLYAAGTADPENSAAKQRKAALALLAPARDGDVRLMWTTAQGASRFGKTGRDTLRRAIEFQQLWLRDLLRARYGAPREALVNRDMEAEIRAEAAPLDAAEIRRRLMVLEEALRSIEGNISPDLTLFSTITRVAGHRLGEGTWPAHNTGRWDY